MLTKQEILIILLHDFELIHIAMEATENTIKAWKDEAIIAKKCRHRIGIIHQKLQRMRPTLVN